MSSRRPNNFLEIDVQVTHSHASTTATLTSDIYVVPAGRSLVIDRVLYIPEASLSISGSSYVAIEILNGSSTVAASATTFTGGTALVAGTAITLTNSATVANLNVAASTVVRLSLVCTSSPAVGTGTVRLEGRLL